MKKITLLLFSLLGTVLAVADERSESEMLDIARHQLQKSATARGLSADVMSVKKVGQGRMYGLYANGDGFVVVSSDDDFSPVLGYSDGEYTGEQAPGFRWWLKAIDEGLAIRKQQGVQKAEVYFEPVENFVMSKWSQESPYNYLTPKQNNRATLTGCVATAMAQILNYYQFPERGVGTGSYTLGSSSSSISVDVNGEYQWNLIKNVYLQIGTTAQQKTAIGTLMRDCGYASKMNYSTEGSGTATADAALGFAKNFSLDTLNVRYAIRDCYRDEEWMAIVYSELMAKRPVMYSGVDVTEKAGHAFVFSGIDNEGKIYVNWGWGGTSDGFFDISDLAPTGIQGGTGTDHFNAQQDMIYGLTPERAPEGTPGKYSEFAFITGGSYSVTSLYGGSTLTIQTTGGLYNAYYLPFKGSIYLHLENADLSVQRNLGIGLSNVRVQTLGGYQALTQQITLPSTLPAGTYRMFLASKDDKETDVQPVRSHGGAIEYTLTKSESGTISIGSATPFTTSIGDVSSDYGAGAKEVARYNLGGQRVTGAQRGLSIVRMSDGRVVKVMK